MAGLSGHPRLASLHEWGRLGLLHDEWAQRHPLCRVTSGLPKRAYEHREGLVDGFTKQHGLKRLVYYEWHDTIQSAIQREKNIKHWPRAWKVRLIHSMNPNWDDLYDTR